MRHIWSVLCGRVILEAGTNKLNLIDLPEALIVSEAQLAIAMAQGQEKPLLPAGFPLLSLFWLGSDDEPGIEMRLTLQGPAEGDRRPTLTTLTVPPIKDKKNSTVRVITMIQGITYYGTGVYEISVQVRVFGKKPWRTVADIPLILRYATSDELALFPPIAPGPPSGPTPVAPQGSSSPRGPSRPSRRRASRAPRPRGSS
jgi:hypothetical protein